MLVIIIPHFLRFYPIKQLFNAGGALKLTFSLTFLPHSHTLTSLHPFRLV